MNSFSCKKIVLFVKKQIRGSGRELRASKYKKRIKKLFNTLKLKFSFEIKKLVVVWTYQSFL